MKYNRIKSNGILLIGIGLCLFSGSCIRGCFVGGIDDRLDKIEQRLENIDDKLIYRNYRNELFDFPKLNNSYSYTP